jgi:hypothetical protein
MAARRTRLAADARTTRGAARAQRVAAGKSHRRKTAVAELEAEPAAEAQATRGKRGMHQRAATRHRPGHVTALALDTGVATATPLTQL